MCKEAVEWLRDYARRYEQSLITRALNQHGGPTKSYEIDLALKFADEIEQRFVLSVADLASAPSSFPPTPIHSPAGNRRRK